MFWKSRAVLFIQEAMMTQGAIINLMFSFFKKRILGIDLGSKHIKIIELEKNKKGVQLLNYSIVSIFGAGNMSGNIETAQLFEENLGKLLLEGTKELKTKQVMFSIPTPFLFSSFFSIPFIPQKALKGAIELEAKKYIPVGLNEVQLQYRVFPYQNPFKEDQKRWLVFLLGVPIPLIRKLEHAAAYAKLTYKGAHPELLNIEPFFTHTGGKQLVIDLGTGYSLLSVLDDGKIVFGKRLRFEFYSVVSNIAKLVGLSWDKAEEILMEKGLYVEEEKVQLKEIMQSYTLILSQELQEEMKNLKDRFGLQADQVWISGGVTNIPGFIESLKKHLQQTGVDILNPFINFQGVEKESSIYARGPIFTNAAGVCLKFLE
ncbi:MAG: hypothetical protein UU76_C0016G0005 [Parcubacteria group bacterium GW2011_GWC1_41_7]|nr:MAG: hypothetical protein UU76_C0016G0005 [Parcubacteria group bacterium GW2011_GWC1_41_7]